MHDKPDTMALAHKALDTAIAQAREFGQTGHVFIRVDIREGTPNGVPKVGGELSARVR